MSKNEEEKNPQTSNPNVLDAHTYSSTLGQAAWLMTLSKEYRDLPISELEPRVATPLLLRQFKLYFKGKQPVAFLSWAFVSDEIKARFEAGDHTLSIQDWKSGSNLVIVDCVSPFNPKEVMIEEFMKGVMNPEDNMS